MPKPRRDPYVAVDATIRKNAKLAALPSDTARLGWIYVGLGDAKLQRPAGRFASRAHWLEVAGRFGRFVREYLAVGLLEEAPRLCDRCRSCWGDLPAGVLVVHDWKRHQTDPGAAERAEGWRGDRPLNGAHAPIERPSHEDQTPIERSLTRAGTRSRGTPRGESEEEGESEEGSSEGLGAVADPLSVRTRPKRVGTMTRIGEVDTSVTLDRRQLDAWASFGSEWDGMKAAWLARGLRYPPSGSADDDPDAVSPSQRALLWSVLDAQPHQLPGWITGSPKGASAVAVIGHVLERWHAVRDEGVARAEAAETAWAAEKAADRETAPTASWFDAPTPAEAPA